MKIRNGFISNSSSASFVVVWRCSKIKKGDSAIEALSILFDMDISQGLTYRDGILSFINKCSQKNLQSNINKILKNTIKVGEEVFKSSFFTCMHNSHDDFGEACQFLLMFLICENAWRPGGSFELLDTMVEED